MGSNWGKKYMKHYLLSSKAVLQTIVAKKTPHLEAREWIFFSYAEENGRLYANVGSLPCLFV